MAKTLSKEERKELARKAMEARAKEPAKKQGAGFAQLDADAKKLQNYKCVLHNILSLINKLFYVL